MTSLLSKHNTHQYEDSVTSNDDTLIWVSRTVTYPSNIINFFITELFNGNARHKTHCLKEHWKIIFFFCFKIWFQHVRNLNYKIHQTKHWSLKCKSSANNSRVISLLVMSWVRQLVTRFSQRRIGFAPRSVHAGSVVDRVALGRTFLQILQF